MNIIVIIFAFMIAFLLQYLLTFLQMRNFVRYYKEYRSEGYRAAIGKFSGVYHAGAITMFAIDKNDLIVKGTALQGVTALSRFKDFNQFNGEYIGSLTEQMCKDKKLSYSLTKSVINTSDNFNTIMRGEEVPIPPSPIGKLGLLITNSVKKMKNIVSSKS